MKNKDYQYQVSQLENKQKRLKKEIKKYKKRTPYFIIGTIFLSVLIISLLDGLLDSYFGKIKDLTIIVSSITVFIGLTFIFINYKNISVRRKESKEIGIQIYNQLKLKDE